jgi:serine/threonine-protein kinase HipA
MGDWLRRWIILIFDAKYEKDGGPGMTQILTILARGETPERDSSLFALSQLMFRFLAATDGRELLHLPAS